MSLSKLNVDGKFFLQEEEMRDDQLPEFNRIRNSCRKFLHDQRYFSLDDTIKWYITQIDNMYYPILTAEESMIGYFRLSPRYDQWPVCIGADLDERYRGMGIAKGLYPQVMNEVYNQFDTQLIYLEVLAHNFTALRLYESLGFQFAYSKRLDNHQESIRMEFPIIDFYTRYKEFK